MTFALCPRRRLAPRIRRARAVAAGLLLVTFAGVTASADEATGSSRIDWRDRWSTVEARPVGAQARAFHFTTGGVATPVHERTVIEHDDGPRLETGNAIFDGLFALAIEEAREDSVEQISDGQFNGGRPIPCHCYETGARWHYVWTRDISYSVDLGLRFLDPERALASLQLKQSGLRAGAADADARYVAQDTGSGGSWPVSTDRVVWIHAARGVLDALEPARAVQELPSIARIARDTLRQDRTYAFDARVGLYRGETSFLDWREQSYPAFTRTRTRYIAGSYSLSTNVLHYVALRDAAVLARRAGEAAATGFDREAEALRGAIQRRFWRPEVGLYASYVGADLSGAAAYDALGLALAIIHGVASPAQARSILARYPSTEAGPPVIWPEQPGIAIYHNRAVWPFVTGYALEAARHERLPRLMTDWVEALVRGAALNLSNMENFEFLTQAVHVEDGPLSGPVINSPRQLWSVAGYVGMVEHSLFGIEFSPDGLSLHPAIPGLLAHRLFEGQVGLSLRQLATPGRMVDVTLRLPVRWSDDDLLEAGVVAVDGTSTPLHAPIDYGVRGAGRLSIAIQLAAVPRGQFATRRLSVREAGGASPRERDGLYAAPSPAAPVVARSGVHVRIAPMGLLPGYRWQLQRDGVVVRTGLGVGIIDDRLPDRWRTVCYSLTEQAPAGEHRSLPGPERCVEGASGAAVYRPGEGLRSPDGHAVAVVEGERRYVDWGAPTQALELTHRTPRAGPYQLTLRYLNGSGPINTGITAAVKRVSVDCGPPNRIQRGVLVLPHLADATTIESSTAFVFDAPRNASCRLRIEDGFNMSYLTHFTLYTGGRGGESGPWNRATIEAAVVEEITTRTHAGR